MGNKFSLIKKENYQKNVVIQNPESNGHFSSDESTTTLGNNQNIPETVENQVNITSLKENANENSIEVDSISNPHTDQNSSQKESITLNENAAKLWQPQYYHMMRPDARLDNTRRFHNIEESPYFLPADIQEQDRLEAQHLVIVHCFGGLFKMPIHETVSKPGSKILDVGCGPGSWTRDVATLYPLCEVHAIDMAKTLFDGIETLPNTFFLEGNIIQGLPYPDNYFDGVFQRYLLAGIPKDKWDFAISELVRVVKPGGFVESLEFDVRSKSFDSGPIAEKLSEARKIIYGNIKLSSKI
ncbi:hypothetical protein HK096_000803 [Nowakowskiella sp. JEL0078]|nr:hypothetical protein HK096_000803 [Nowakowskiella sp. JEL0078]